jgi:hypothetical protein
MRVSACLKADSTTAKFGLNPRLTSAATASGWASPPTCPSAVRDMPQTPRAADSDNPTQRDGLS